MLFRSEELLGAYRASVEEAKHLLSEAGSGHGFLSGSGPSVFCILEHGAKAEEIFGRIPDRKNMRAYLATTYKGGIYGDN